MGYTLTKNIWLPVFLFAFLIPRYLAGQQNTSAGKSFYFSSIANTSLASIDLTFSSLSNTTVKIENPSKSYSKTCYITANIPYTVSIPYGICTPPNIDSVENYAIHITADNPITAYAVNYYTATAEGTLLLPETENGSKYYVVNHEGPSLSHASQCIIVGFEDNTVIKITPSANTYKGHQAGTPYTVTLNKGETYLEAAYSSGDLSGTLIENLSGKKFAVFGGALCINIGGCPACDVTFDQLLPFEKLGRKYLLAPPSTTTLTPDYSYKIVSAENNNNIYLNGIFAYTLQQGGVKLVDTQSGTLCIESDRQILVAQFTKGNQCVGVGDPSMVIIPPIEQLITRVNYSVPAFSGFTDHYAYVMLKNSAINRLYVDGNNISASNFSPFSYCNDYSFTTLSLSSGNHLVECDSGFIMVAYGYGFAMSYAYIGGTDFKKLTYEIAVDNLKCGNLDFNFSNIGFIDKITASKWDFGDGTSDTGLAISKTYSAHGTYTIINTLTINDNGYSYSDTLIYILKTLDKPVARISVADTVQCFWGNNFILTDSSQYEGTNKKKTSEWTFTDNSSKFINKASINRRFATPSFATVRLKVTADNGCTDMVSQRIEAKKYAQSKFTHTDPQCFNNHVFAPLQFSVVDSTASITGYSWYFGDGTVGTAPQPVRHYADTGTYIVELVTLLSNNCNDTAYDTITILPSPKAGFTIANVCDKDSVVMVNTSSIAKGTLSYYWEYGDGGFDTAFQTNRLYADTGLKIVKLIAVSDKLCADTITKQVSIKPKPIAGFTHTKACEGNTVTFTGATQRFGIPVNQNKWVFGNGATIANQGSVVHVYAGAGSYTAKLVTEGANGCKDSISRPLFVNPTPKANFNINNDEQCVKGNYFTFTNSSTIGGGAITSYNWIVDNTLPGIALTNITRTFSTAGQYNVKLVIGSDSSCFDSLTKSVTVNPNISVDFGINDSAQCFKGHLFGFTNNSVVNGTGSISTYNWAFSDGGEDNLPVPLAKRFAAEGVYSLRGIMLTDKGCADTVIRKMFVEPSPLPDFAAKDVCFGDSVLFDNTTPDIASPPVLVWAWDFGDGKTSGDRMPYHKYVAAGNYLVSLKATTVTGCSDSIVQFLPDLVHPYINAFFTEDLIDSYEKLSTYQFTNASTGAAFYLWDFGDGTSATDAMPVKVFSDMGYFMVNLAVENQWGCKDNFSKKILVVPNVDIQIPNAFTPGSRDNLNPVFRVEGVYFTKEFEMHIFNRWGELMFQSQEAGLGWDGTFEGNAAPDGVYLYLVRVLDLKNQLHIYRGTLHLLR